MWEFYGQACQKIESIDGSYDTPFRSEHRQFTNESLLQVRRNGKPRDEEVEEMLDSQLATINSSKSIPSKSKGISNIDKMTRLWLVVAKALKTTEEVTDPNTKITVLTKVIKASLAFSLHYRHQIQSYLNSHPEAERKQEHGFLVRFMPLIHEHVLKDALGTEKLNVLIKQKIEKDLLTISSNGAIDVSEYERFVTVFLYADLDGDGYKNMVRTFIDSAHNKTLLDMSAFKLLGYYLFKSNTATSDDFFLNALGDLSKGSGGGNGKMKASEKTKAIENYQKLRTEKYGKSPRSKHNKKRRRK
jgi:hypothetical protein